MSSGEACRCSPKNREQWYVLCLRHNHSAFNGYHKTPSDYSLVKCTACNAHWRTTAAYVASLALAPNGHR